ncbi:hypothetical protein PMAYCL1PPCAC_27016, partial [Pristionchus mayeri]
LQHSKSDSVKIVNPDAHDNIIERAEELKGNKIYQVELRWRKHTAWACVLGHHRTCRDSLGDLFGPYHVQAEDKHWPEFLTEKPANVSYQKNLLI